MIKYIRRAWRNTAVGTEFSVMSSDQSLSRFLSSRNRILMSTFEQGSVLRTIDHPPSLRCKYIFDLKFVYKLKKTCDSLQRVHTPQ